MKTLRIVVGKIGLDGHDRGAKIVAAGLRDAGFEVIYTGIRHTPKSVAFIAAQEDADVLAISILSGVHNKLCTKIRDELVRLEADDMLCIVGGIIPSKDVPYLNSVGFKGVFTPGTEIQHIIDFIKENAQNKEYKEQL